MTETTVVQTELLEESPTVDAGQHDRPPTAGSAHANRACEACRAVKLKCLPGDASQPDSSVCLRCYKSNRPCVYLPSKRRKPRKRTDTRVAELEREVRKMHDLLNRPRAIVADDTVSDFHAVLSAETTPESFANGDVHAAITPTQHQASPGHLRSGRYDVEQSSTESASPESQPVSNPNQLTPLLTHELSQADPTATTATNVSQPDVVDMGLVTMEMAEHLLSRFNKTLVQHSPFVFFPPEVTAAELRRNKPVLFLAAIAAGASGTLDEDLYQVLDLKVSQIYAEQIVVKGWKSLELIQALIITAIWSYPPDRFADAKFYQYIHMAICMVQVLNVDRDVDVKLGATEHGRGVSFKRTPNTAHERLQTLLGCYLCSAGVAVSMRRTTIFSFTNQLAKFVDHIEKTATTSLERELVVWVKLQRIAEEMAVALHFDDPNTAINLAEPRVQLMIKAFEKQYAEWRRTMPPDMPPSMLITYHFHCLNLHEVALYLDHTAESFRPPFFVQMVNTQSELSSSLAPAFVDAITACVDSAHSLLEVVLKIEPADLRSLPMVHFARMSYTVLVLVKLAISSLAPKSRIGRVVEPEQLKVIEYLDRLMLHLMDVLRLAKSQTAGKFLATLFKLKAWYVKRGFNTESKWAEWYNTTPAQHAWVDKQAWNPNMPQLAESSDLGAPSGNDDAQREPRSLPSTTRETFSPSQNIVPPTSTSTSSSFSGPGPSTYAASAVVPGLTSLPPAGIYAARQNPANGANGAEPMEDLAYNFNTTGLSEADAALLSFNPRSFNIFGDMDLDIPMQSDDWMMPAQPDGQTAANFHDFDFGSMLGQF